MPNPALANYTITSNSAAFTIAKLAASVTPNAASKVYGTADPTFTGTLSGFLPADGITATYSRTTGETVAGSPYTISATLSPTAALSKLHDHVKHRPPSPSLRPHPASPGMPRQESPTAPPLSGTPAERQLARFAGNFAYNPGLGSVQPPERDTLSVTFTPTDTSDYTNATTTVPLTVSQATPVVSWPTPASISYGTGTGPAQKTATATGIGGASLPGSYFYTTPDGTVFGVGTHPLGVAFTPTDITDYVPVSAFTYITVTQAKPIVTWNAPAAITYGTALSVHAIERKRIGAGQLRL